MPTTNLRDYVIKINKHSTHGHHINREETPSTGPYLKQPKLLINIEPENDFFQDNGLQFKSTLGDAIQHFEDKLNDQILKVLDRPHLLTPLESNNTKWGDAFLKQTIEGQQILERIISDHTNWTKPAKLPYLKNPDENITTVNELIIHQNIELSDGERWEQEKDELEKHVENINPIENIDLNKLDLTAHTHTYAIRFLDNEWNHWLYIGKSKNIINKLQTQIRQSGTFKEANNTRMEALKIEELKPGNKKETLYKQAINKYDIPKRRITGVYSSKI